MRNPWMDSPIKFRNFSPMGTSCLLGEWNALTLTLSQREEMVVCRRRLVGLVAWTHFQAQPALGVDPIGVGGGGGDAQGLGGLVDGQPGEVAEFNELGLARI